MILSSIVFLPLLFAFIIACWPKANTVKHLALGFSVIQFVLSLVIFKHFDPSLASLQMVEKYTWIERFGISYFIGVDGISFWLVLLTTFLVPVSILGSWNSVKEKAKGFHAALFVLQTALLGTFVALDGILFYVFWELSLVPMYFLIGIWGGPKRIFATVKFFIFTMAGSVLMLVSIIYMMFLVQNTTGHMSASILDFYGLKIPFIGGTLLSLQTVLFFAFAFAFAVKAAVIPLHTWLPDTYGEAPTAGSMMLAAVMAKMGSYAFLRWVIPMFPEAAESWSYLFIILGVVGIIYGALLAMVQTDIKRVIAYSSVSHMAYILVGTFTFNMYGVTGGLYQMLNHGITIAALFLMVGMLQERFENLEIKKFGGVAKALPLLSIFFFIFTMSSIAVPMTNGFVGEFLILVGAYSKDPVIAYGAVLGVILGAVYMLWMFKKVFFGAQGELIRNEEKPVFDLTAREVVVLVPLVILVFWMGLLPNNFLNYSKASVDHLIKHRTSYSLSAGALTKAQSIEAVSTEAATAVEGDGSAIVPAMEATVNNSTEAQGDK